MWTDQQRRTNRACLRFGEVRDDMFLARNAVRRWPLTLQNFKLLLQILGLGHADGTSTNESKDVTSFRSTVLSVLEGW